MSLVTIGWYTNPLQAHIAQGRLQAEGLFSCVVHEHHIWVNWMYSNVLGGVKIQVLEDDIEHGEIILKQLWQGEFEPYLEPLFGQLEKPLCPICSHDEITHRVSLGNSTLVFIFLLLTSVAYPPPKNIRQCDTCSHQWFV